MSSDPSSNGSSRGLGKAQRIQPKGIPPVYPDQQILTGLMGHGSNITPGQKRYRREYGIPMPPTAESLRDLDGGSCISPVPQKESKIEALRQLSLRDLEDLVKTHGSQRAAGVALGVTQAAISVRLRELRELVVRSPSATDNNGLPPPVGM